MDTIDLTIEVQCLRAEVAMKKAEAAYFRAAFEEFIEVVDDALLLDEELAQAWDDLEKGVVRARKALGEADRLKISLGLDK